MPTPTLVRAAVATLCAAAALSTQAAALMADPPGGSSAAPAGAEAPATWWTGFQEQALDRLQEVARASTGTWTASQQADLALAYVTLRVQTLRLQNAAELRETTRRQREHIASASPTREAARTIAVLEERIAGADRALLALAQERDAALRRLLQLTSADADAAKAALAEALDNRDLPAFRREVPQRLPASVLLSRSDVAEAERNLAAHSPMSMLLSGWIAPAAQPAPIALPGNDTGMGDTLRQAGHEVSWSLRQLIDASRQAATDARRLEARRLELMAAQRRVEAGDADPADVLESYQQFLAEADAMALAQSRLALAWIVLHANAPGSNAALAALAR